MCNKKKYITIALMVLGVFLSILSFLLLVNNVSDIKGTWFALMIVGIVSFCISLSYNKKISEGTVSTSCQKMTSNSQEHYYEYAELMTGQLVALYKQNHDEAYMNEYIRRLQKIGFSVGEAQNFFMYESMNLKQNSTTALLNDRYLKTFYFDLKTVRFPEDKDFYISHQMFTLSEVVKIWDEAEWHYHNSHENEFMPEVWNEIFKISRYGGGELFVEYLQSMSDNTKTDIKKIQKYVYAEQGLLYKYKWYPNVREPHPYF